MPSIQNFSISYEALNDYGTFSEGDALRGRVTLALTKQIAVESVFIKVTGDASVSWTERVGERSYTYSAAHRYFKLKQPVILASAKGRWQILQELRTRHVACQHLELIWQTNRNVLAR